MAVLAPCALIAPSLRSPQFTLLLPFFRVKKPCSKPVVFYTYA